MKSLTLVVAVATLLSNVSAHQAHHHDVFHAKKALNDTEVCLPKCTTIYYTVTGEYIWTPTPGPPSMTTTSMSAPPAAITTPAAVPTPAALTCASAGTCVFPGSTITLTSTVVVPALTTYVPGIYTAAPVTTVVATSTVIYCPYTTSVAAPALEVIKPSSTSASASAPPASSPVALTAGSLGGTGKQWAITYTPYEPSTGTCKSASEVMTDIKSIAAAGFTSVRVYSTDCDTLPNVGAAIAATGLKMIAGVFIGDSSCGASSNVAAQLAALQAWARWDLVELIAIGNEAMFNGYCSPQQLGDLISSAKAQLGYNGPFTTTDTVAGWQLSGVAAAICPVVDFPAANIHAYFNSETAPAEAGSFVQNQLAIVEAICGKAGVVLESGYPKEGVCNGLNCPSASNQQSALTSIQSTMGSKVVFFSMYDDMWKGAGSCGCETSFGCAPLFGIL